MSEKNYTEVLIDGEIYTVAGTENETYIQEVARYISDLIFKLKQSRSFKKQSQEYQAIMIELNIADELFKCRQQLEQLREQIDAMEKDSYSLKHELVTTQLKLETAQKELNFIQAEKTEKR